MTCTAKEHQALKAQLEKCLEAVRREPDAKTFVDLAITYELLGLSYYLMHDQIKARTCFMKSYIACKSVFAHSNAP